MVRAILAIGLSVVAAMILIVGVSALLDGRYLLSIACALYSAIALFLAVVFAEVAVNG